MLVNQINLRRDTAWYAFAHDFFLNGLTVRIAYSWTSESTVLILLFYEILFNKDAVNLNEFSYSQVFALLVFKCIF